MRQLHKCLNGKLAEISQKPEDWRFFTQAVGAKINNVFGPAKITTFSRGAFRKASKEQDVLPKKIKIVQFKSGKTKIPEMQKKCVSKEAREHIAGIFCSSSPCAAATFLRFS
jgi:hypothetical protein